MVLEIYQSCNTSDDFDRAFDRLEGDLVAKIRINNAFQKTSETSSILRIESSEEKKQSFDATNADIEKYLHDVKYWNSFGESLEFDGTMHYWKVEGWGEKVLGAHGSLFVGAFGNSAKWLPALLLCNEDGACVPCEEVDLVQKLEQIDNTALRYFTPTASEINLYRRAYGNLKAEMQKRYQAQVNPIKELNKKKMENLSHVQKIYGNEECKKIQREIDKLEKEKLASKNLYDKADIQRKIDVKHKRIEKIMASSREKEEKIKAKSARELEESNKQFDNPKLQIDIILKF